MSIWQDKSNYYLHYLLGLHWVNNGCFLGFFADKKVHVVVLEGRDYLDVHCWLEMSDRTGVQKRDKTVGKIDWSLS